MHTTARRKAAAILVVVGLLFTAFPTAAAPGRPAEQPGVRAWVDTVITWFVAIWPGSSAAFPLRSVGSPLGPDGDPDGGPQATSGDLGSTQELRPDLAPKPAQ